MLTGRLIHDTQLGTAADTDSRSFRARRLSSPFDQAHVCWSYTALRATPRACLSLLVDSFSAITRALLGRSCKPYSATLLVFACRDIDCLRSARRLIQSARPHLSLRQAFRLHTTVVGTLSSATHGRSRPHRAVPRSHVADHPLIQCVSRCGPPLESAFRPVSDRPRPALQPPRLGLAWLTLRRPSPSTGTLQPPPRPPLSPRIGESAPPEPLLFRHLPLTDKVSASPDGLRAGSEWPTGWLVSQPALVCSPTSRPRRPQTADFFSGAP